MVQIVRGPDGVPVMSRSGHEAGHCPWREYQVYDLGVVDDSDYSRRGTAYHACIKRYFQRLIAAQVTCDHEEASVAFEEGISESQCPPHLIAEVRELFEREVQHYELPLANVLAIEPRVVRETPVPYQFRPDLVLGWPEQNVLEVHDHKTYFVALTVAQAKARYQSRYNAWAAMQEYPGWSVYRMTYRFPRLNTQVSCDFLPEEFDALDREVRANEAARQARYAQQQWPAIPGDQCAYCTLRCSVMDDPTRHLRRVRTPDEFAALAGWVLVAERQIETALAALRAYTAIEGPREVNGELFGFFPVTSTTYDAGCVVDAIRELAGASTVRLAASALKAELKRVPGLDVALPDCRPVTTETARFGHKAVKATRKTPDGGGSGGEEDRSRADAGPDRPAPVSDRAPGHN